MSLFPASTADVEEAKVEVEYDEPTDERESGPAVATTTSAANRSTAAAAAAAAAAATTTTATNAMTTSSAPNGVTVDSTAAASNHQTKSPDDDDNDNDYIGDIDDTTDDVGAVNQIKMTVAADAPWRERVWEVITTFWSLGLVAFGGPQAHVAILRDHLVVRRNWISEDEFMELFAIGQGLPGPSSTQLVVSCALYRAGPLGGLIALLLWNLPGLVVLTACGVVIDTYVDPDSPPWFLIGLPPAAIALVFTAFYMFALKLDKLGTLLALLTCLAAILINNDPSISPQSSQFVFPIALALSGTITYIDSTRSKPFGTYPTPSANRDVSSEEVIKRIGIPLWVGACIFATWLILLIASILMVNVGEFSNVYLDIFEKMYRIGSIIFGGGQVVLPLLQDEVVPAWMTTDQFFQGLGLAQSMPGPLFNFSAYLGAVYQGVPGALVAFIGLFGPGVILIFAAVPFWARMRHNTIFRSVLSGVNASAIGLVGAACVTLWVSAIRTSADAMVFSVSLTMSSVYSFQAPYCILMGGVFGAILHPDALNLGQRSYCIKAGYQDTE